VVRALEAELAFFADRFGFEVPNRTGRQDRT